MKFSPPAVEYITFNEEDGTFTLFPVQPYRVTLMGVVHADAQQVLNAFISGKGLARVLHETGGRIKEYDDLVHELILCRVAAGQLSSNLDMTAADREEWAANKEDQLVKERIPDCPFNWEDYTRKDPEREFEAHTLLSFYRKSQPLPRIPSSH